MNIIRPKDFSSLVTDPAHTHNTWSSGALRHVIDALAGRPVLIVTDKQTGHVERGSLVRVFYGGPSRGDRVEVRHEHGTTTHWLPGVGEIIDDCEDFALTNAKYAALDAQRVEARQAIEYVRATLPPAPEGALGYNFTTRTFSDEVQVQWSVCRAGDGLPREARGRAYARGEAGNVRLALHTLREAVQPA
jgi:hypothetical protein